MAGQNMFTGYGAGHVMINHARYERSLIVLPDRIIEDWNANAFDDITAEHFDFELHRRAREHLLEPADPPADDLVPLLAELDARAATEGIDEESAKELLLRLRERQVRRELETADLERTKELQEQLEKIRATAANLA